MWSTRRLKRSIKGYSPVNKLPQSIYPQQIPDAVKEWWVGKSLVKDGFYSMDLSGWQRMLTHSWVKESLHFPNQWFVYCSPCWRVRIHTSAANHMGCRAELLGEDMIQEMLTDQWTILLLTASLILLMNSASQCPEWQRGSMERSEWALETGCEVPSAVPLVHATQFLLENRWRRRLQRSPPLGSSHQERK